MKPICLLILGLKVFLCIIISMFSLRVYCYWLFQAQFIFIYRNFYINFNIYDTKFKKKIKTEFLCFLFYFTDTLRVLKYVQCRILYTHFFQISISATNRPLITIHACDIFFKKIFLSIRIKEFHVYC